MARRRGEEEEISVFNMSFLDVFCCTVGALIFILFVQVVRSRDMVEKKVLEEVREKLTSAQQELERTETARDEAKEEFEKLSGNLEEIRKELGERKEELAESKVVIKEQDEKIGDLLAQLRDPNRPAAPSILSDLKEGALAGSGGGRIGETQKLSRGKYLLGNLETRSIVCSAEGLYLGMSREALPLAQPDLQSIFRGFVRYHDPDQEGLWRTSWHGGGKSYNKSIVLQAAEKSEIGKGLVVQKDRSLSDAQKSMRSGGKTVSMDLDGDGAKETQFEDSDNDGTLDVKRVNLDSDPFHEEVFLAYDEEIGQWGQVLVDADGDDKYDVLYQDTVKSDSDYEMKYVLPNLQTGNAVFQYEDTDNDGSWDIKYENTDLTNDAWEKTYALFDPDKQRWGAVMVDSDANGKPDLMYRDTDMSNDDWEEKLIDTNGDNVWDIRWQDLDPRDNDWEVKFTEHKGDTEIWKRCEIDSDADGAMDAMLVDTDGDGQWDEEYTFNKEKKDWVSK